MTPPIDIRKTGLNALDHVSRNFRRWEYLCPHCGQGAPTQQLIMACQLFRDIVGVPVTFNSSGRCPYYNAKVGGTPNSQHPKGTAVDIPVLPGFTIYSLYEAALEVPAFKAGGIGLYPDRFFGHFDTRGTKARWVDGPLWKGR